MERAGLVSTMDARGGREVLAPERGGVRYWLALFALCCAWTPAWAGALDQLHRFFDSTRSFRAEFSQLVTSKGWP